MIQSFRVSVYHERLRMNIEFLLARDIEGRNDFSIE